MIDIIDDTLSLWRREPFKWGGIIPHVPGVGDCLLSVGEYIARCGGLDVASRFRGTYDDEAGAMGRVEAHGGIESIIDLTGLARITEPARGDVVAVDIGETIVGAICTGPGIAMRTERGVIEVNKRFLKITQAWKIS